MKALLLTLSFFLIILSVFNLLAANAHVEFFGINPTSPKEAISFLLVSFFFFFTNYFSIEN